MSTVRQPVEQRFVVSGIDWDTYLTFSDKLGERNIRLNYDGASLELMTLSSEHERAKNLLGLLLNVLAEELDLNMVGFGSMTCRREDRERGLEPDECYWIAHATEIHGRDHIDLTTDPPPDLVVEVEISRSILDRLAICARLGVPETWRWDGRVLRVMLLGADGQYAENDRSQALPFLPMAELARFVTQGVAQTNAQFARAFRTWVREQMARNWQG